MVRNIKFIRGHNQNKESFIERTSLTNLIIYINVIVFIIVTLLIAFNVAGEIKESDAGILKYLALSPELFTYGYFWTLITSMFMHAGFGHLLVNMVSMFFIGNLIEKIIGRKRFLWFYMIAGIVAGLSFVGLAYLGLFFGGGQSFLGEIGNFAVGASGALFGLGGLLAVLIPRLRVFVFFFIPMPMWLAMVVLMFGIWILSAFGGLPIGNTAHFGGLVVGVIYGFYLRNKYARKVAVLNRIFV